MLTAIGAVVIFACILTLMGIVSWGYQTFPGRLAFLFVIIYTLSPMPQVIGLWNILALIVINMAAMLVEVHFREKESEEE